jgi:hypothetical protein
MAMFNSYVKLPWNNHGIINIENSGIFIPSFENRE